VLGLVIQFLLMAAALAFTTWSSHRRGVMMIRWRLLYRQQEPKLFHRYLIARLAIVAGFVVVTTAVGIYFWPKLLA